MSSYCMITITRALEQDHSFQVVARLSLNELAVSTLRGGDRNIRTQEVGRGR